MEFSKVATISKHRQGQSGEQDALCERKRSCDQLGLPSGVRGQMLPLSSKNWNSQLKNFILFFVRTPTN